MNILSKIRGQHVAVAGQTLPNCATDNEDFRLAELHVPEYGRVFFLFRRFSQQAREIGFLVLGGSSRGASV